MRISPPQIDPLAERVGDFIDARKLAPPRGAIVVAVSGGPDSVALLAILRELSAAGRDYRLTVAHLDHALRSDSAADSAWVGQLAGRFSLPFITERVDVRAMAEREGKGVEEAAREARYAFLTRAARQAGASVVAAGHHADDNVETVLHRIVRGTHLRGLAGIAAARPLGPDAALIRPMLQCTRAEIHAYCRRASLEYLTDSSNADTKYTRNFIRHELLPLLRDKINPRADQAIGRLAAAAADAEELIASAADDLLGRAVRRQSDTRAEIDAVALAEAPTVVAAAAVRRLLDELGAGLGQIGAERLEQIVALASAAAPAAVTLAADFEARRDRHAVVLCRHAPTDQTDGDWNSSVELACPGSTTMPSGVTITCEIMPFDRVVFDRHCLRTGLADTRGVEFLDADCVRLPLTCSPRGDGDSFRPLGSPGRQSISDFLTNLKAPPEVRRRVLCLSDADGIVYLAPLRIDDRARITQGSSRVIKLTITSPSTDADLFTRDGGDV